MMYYYKLDEIFQMLCIEENIGISFINCELLERWKCDPNTHVKPLPLSQQICTLFSSRSESQTGFATYLVKKNSILFICDSKDYLLHKLKSFWKKKLQKSILKVNAKILQKKTQRS